MTPAYYLGRRVHVFRATSHPATYTYTWVRETSRHGNQVLRLAKADAYWRDRRRYPL